MTTTRDVLRIAQPPLRRFLPGVLWGLASAAAAVALLACSGWLIVSASVTDTLVTLNVAIVGVRFFAVSRAAFRYLERLTGHDAALRQLATTRSDLMRRLVPLAPDGVSRTDRGSVLSSLVDDVEELQNLPLRVVQPVVIGSLTAIGSVVAICIIRPAAGLALAVCLITAAVAAVGWGWLVGSRAEREIAPARARLTSALTDYIGSFDVLVAFGAEERARAQVLSADQSLRRLVTRTTSAQGASSAVLSALAGIASLAAVAVTAPTITDPASGAWLAVVALVPMVVFETFATVPLAASSWRRVHSAAGRIASLLPADLPPELAPDLPDESEDRIRIGIGVRLRDVRAGWPDRTGRDVLRGVDLDVAPGERILVTGPSGAGKSTLAHVLVRFLESRGSYTVDGVDVHDVAGSMIRRTVGMSEQQPHLFDEDIRQNLLFARPDASDAELEAAVERVGLGDWLRQRGGLDARVGERGALVSGGQAQRLALARALLHDVDVLVLDEPTAGVDPAMSDALLRDLLGATAGESNRAVVLISHVDVPAELIDRTLRLEDGRLISA
ncbi:thiol reductant ABC exporter subunit CydC [Microbacterium sp. ZW T5_56]|uniref:thiol reductant ABC exporter subunit CydC n=1 Tax=Microbacterium sp. ZW T5_56 TaxID=3378081 RepID=UPI003851B81E